MNLLKTSFNSNKSSYKILFVLWGCVLFASMVLWRQDGMYFQRFLGSTHPLLAMGLSGLIGFLGLFLLENKGVLGSYKSGNVKELFRFFLIVVPLVSIAIVIDLKIVFPMDMNILFPKSLLFYSAMAFLVEMLFHSIPLALVFPILLSIFKTISTQKLLWIALLIIAIFEPTYQIYMDTYPNWAMAIVWINLFLFNLLQLMVLKRYGFIFMYAMRLFYYLIWHICWGELRLVLLNHF